MMVWVLFVTILSTTGHTYRTALSEDAFNTEHACHEVMDYLESRRMEFEVVKSSHVQAFTFSCEPHATL